ncbi:fis family transcriptional regulator [Halothece sp. PCC 7418]|uniref:hypothetical protein n=1 Tax=Halothece sp. (strain PCC 7418) TaxID=65093 RepID=UPI0002A0841E|nr:hypothetical protein [Halothece sp. PCC 7418]AFZ43387.1 fis family transcriptional regulator [Halothece sp. PCC 7418]
MEPISALATTVTAIILPKVLEKASETVGMQIGKAAFQKTGETIQRLKTTVQEKLEAAGTVGLLKRAEEKPEQRNLEILEGELVNQMEEDQEFATKLEELIQQIQAQSPSLQVVLDEVKVKGSAEIGNIEQVSEGGSGEQVAGRNLEVGGDLKMGDVNQRNQRV